ncbi:MAG: 50S ribosomal protein L13e [Thermoprotei archaeon]|nr:MAG: 50S ribosomal protein L13e [Thermoprotei archaeon]
MSAEERCCIVVEVPAPIVKKPRLLKFAGVDPGTRVGRGFSLGELREAGISEELAHDLGIPIDKRRRSVHEWNVQALREFKRKIEDLIQAKKAKPARIAVVKAKS